MCKYIMYICMYACVYMMGKMAGREDRGKQGRQIDRQKEGGEGIL